MGFAEDFISGGNELEKLRQQVEERGREVELLKNSAPEIVSALGEERTARKQAEAEVERLRNSDAATLCRVEAKLKHTEARLREVVAIINREAPVERRVHIFERHPILGQILAAAQPEEKSRG